MERGEEERRRKGKKQLREEERPQERKGGEKKKTGGTRRRQLFFSFCISLTNTSRHSDVSMVTTWHPLWDAKLVAGRGRGGGRGGGGRRGRGRWIFSSFSTVIEVCGWALSQGTSMSVGVAVLLFAVLFAPDSSVNRRESVILVFFYFGAFMDKKQAGKRR